MKVQSTGVLVLALLGLLVCDNASAASKGQTQRQKEEQACYEDAMKLCQEFVPDEDKITTCMGAKKSQLSPACRKVFDEGPKN